MSFAHVRPYFKARIKAVDPDLIEWKESLETEGIPAPQLRRSYFIEIGTFNQIQQNQECLDAVGTATVELFAKGQGKPTDGIDSVIARGQDILIECLKAANRATQPSIKNIKLISFTPQSFDKNDDHDIRLRMVFSINLTIDLPR